MCSKLDELVCELESAGLIEALEGEYFYRKALEYFEKHVKRLINPWY